MSIEVVYEGMKIDDLSNFYKKKALLNVLEFYKIVLAPLINELESEKLYLKIFIEENFQIEKIDFFEDSEKLYKTWISLLKPFFKNGVTICKLNEVQFNGLLINRIHEKSKKVV